MPWLMQNMPDLSTCPACTDCQSSSTTPQPATSCQAFKNKFYSYAKSALISKSKTKSSKLCLDACSVLSVES